MVWYPRCKVGGNVSYYSPDRDEYLYAKDRGARCAVDNHVPGHRLVFRLRYNYLGVIMVVPSAYNLASWPDGLIGG